MTNIKTPSTKDILARIEGLIANPPENSRVLEYTPEVAAVILDNKNKGNRGKKPNKIKEYAEYITNGEWGLTGDTIKFGTDGMLKDGQNRLRACVLAQKTFRSHTVFGIDHALFSFMDIGRTRGHADIFAIAGVPNSSDTAAAVRWAVILSSENPLSRDTVTNDELLHHYRERFSDIGESVKVGQSIRRILQHPTGAMAALHYLFSKVDQPKADEFFIRWSEGRYSKRSCPIKALQDRLQSIKAQNYGRVHDGVRNALVIKAWNHFRKGAALPLDHLSWHMGEGFPKIGG